jgi:DNA-binding MarR family transcriptional regulator
MGHGVGATGRDGAGPPVVESAAGRAPDGSGVRAGEVAELLMHAAHQLRRSTQRVFAPLGLTPAQERALRIVTRAGGSVRMGEIASRMGIVPRSATGLVDRLVEAGLVLRAVDPDNRRSVLVTLSEQGQRLQTAMADARTAAAEELLRPLTAAQRESLADLLARLTDQ